MIENKLQNEKFVRPPYRIVGGLKFYCDSSSSFSSSFLFFFYVFLLFLCVCVHMCVHHGMSTSLLQEVLRAIVIGKLCYAWWGFTSADDQQHLDGFIQRSVRQGYCASDLDIVSTTDQADEKLFQLVLTNPNHVLSLLLSDKTDHHYYLRARRHYRQLVDKCTKLFSNNFMICMLYTDSF